EAESFFDSLLVEYLGMEKEQVWESRAGWKGRGSRIYLYERAPGMEGHSLQHLAFAARSRGEVENFPAWASRRGIELMGEPKAFPEYGGDYYAAFFFGPDRLKLELVHLSENDGANAL